MITYRGLIYLHKIFAIIEHSQSLIMVHESYECDNCICMKYLIILFELILFYYNIIILLKQLFV